jgi:UPF0716 protein FxsA
MILVASALLVTPGILTDAVGFAFLVPSFRRFARGLLMRRFERAVREQRVHVHFADTGFGTAGDSDGPGSREPIIDVTPERPPAGREPGES